MLYKFSYTLPGQDIPIEFHKNSAKLQAVTEKKKRESRLGSTNWGPQSKNKVVGRESEIQIKIQS